MSETETPGLRLAFDTNIFAYAEGVDRHPADAGKIETSRRLIARVVTGAVSRVVSVQTLAELHNVLVRKLGLTSRVASGRVERWRSFGAIIETSPTVLDIALGLSADSGLQIFDAIILAAAAEGRCDFLLSEDLQHGFAWRGVVVANPFKPEPEPRLARLLTAAP